MVIIFLNPRVNPHFAPVYAWFRSNSDFKSSSAFSIIFWSSGSICEIGIQRLLDACMTVSHGDRDDRYPFMNQKRSTGVAQIPGTDPFDISDAHHEMRSHIIYSIDAFTLRQLSCPVFGKNVFRSGMDAIPTCVAQLFRGSSSPRALPVSGNLSPKDDWFVKKHFQKSPKISWQTGLALI